MGSRWKAIQQTSAAINKASATRFTWRAVEGNISEP
jgi:hypothetical protein